MLNRKDLLKSKNLLVKKLAQTDDFCLLPTGSPAVFYADIARMDQKNKELEKESKKPIAQVVVKIDADNPMVLDESTTHEMLLKKITTSYVRNKPKDVSEDEARSRAEEDLNLIERSIAQLEMHPVSHYLLGSLSERDSNITKVDGQKQKVTISFSYSGVTVETEEENFDVELATREKLYTLLGKTKTFFDVENYSAERSHARAIAQAKAELARFDEILRRNPTALAKERKEEAQTKLKSLLKAQSPEKAGFENTRVLRLRCIDAINRTNSIPVLLMQFKAPPHKYRDTAAFWWIAGLAAGLIGVGLLFVAPIACPILLAAASVFAAKGWYEDRKNARHVEDRVMPRQALPPVDSDMVSAGASTHADLIRHQRLQKGGRQFHQAIQRSPKKSSSVDNSAAAASQPEQPVESKAMPPDQSVESKATPPDHSENFRPRSPSK